jgi:hypothetical protein
MPDGTLGCFNYEWGVDPGGLITLDERHGIRGKKWKFAGGTWEDLPTELVVGFTDRAFQFQDNSVSVPNQRVADARRTDDQRTLDRKHVMRSAQAYSHGLEAMRRMGFATGTIYVRGPIVAGLQPGAKVKVNTNPEPGGTALAQLVRIDKIETDRTDEVTMYVTVDALLPATAYTPAWISPLPETLFSGAVASSPSLVHLLALPLPPAAFDWPPSVGFVATRPSARISGFRAYFATNPSAAFADLGAQVGFAARMSLVGGVSAGAGTLRLQLADGATGPDAYLAAQTPGGNIAQAEDNTLLAVLVTLDGSGRVAIDGAGLPVMEFATIIERSAITADTHDYTVYRGRCNLAPRAWSNGTIAWIIPRANLQPWRHELFASMLGATAYFRLASFITGAAIDDTIPLPETDMVFPAGYLPEIPTGLTAQTGTGRVVDLGWTAVVDPRVNEYRVYRATGPAYSDEALIGECGGTRFVDIRVVIGTVYRYRVSSCTVDENESAKSASVLATPGVVDGTQVDHTLPANPGQVTKTDEGTYLTYDGATVAFLQLGIPALPARAVGQELRYMRVGGSEWLLATPLYNTAATTLRLDDLSAGIAYRVGLIGFNLFGDPTGLVEADYGGGGATSFTAPGKTTAPAAPTGLATNYPAFGDLAPKYYANRASIISPATRFTWTPPTEKDVVSIEYLVSIYSTPSESLAVNPNCLLPAAKGFEYLYWGPVFLTTVIWARFWDRSGNHSTWAREPGNTLWTGNYAGNLGDQNSDNVGVTGLQVGDGINVRKVLAVYDGSVVVNLVGSAPSETFELDLTNRGFGAKADTGHIHCDDPVDELSAAYVFSDTRNNSTTAVIQVRSWDNVTNIGGGYRRFSVKLEELD